MGAAEGCGVALQASCLEGFDTLGLHHGDVAQLVEQLLHTEPVGGSIPSITTKIYAVSSTGLEHSATDAGVEGSNPLRRASFRIHSATQNAMKASGCGFESHLIRKESSTMVVQSKKNPVV